MNLEDLTGRKFGRLTVLKYHATKRFPSGQTKAQWLCKCDCGQTRIIFGANLKRPNHTLSCGCVQRERTAAATSTHGKSRHFLYETWSSMKKRCLNPKTKPWKNYGGRGITVCQRWMDFVNFYTDMAPTHKPGLTLERKDNNAGYSPQNCKWATRKEQRHNSRQACYTR